MPVVDLVDETFVVVDPAVLADVVHDPARWRSWWPDLELAVFMDRAEKGLRWNVTGALVGSCEIWLEPVQDGVLLHYYLRADPTEPGSATRPASLPQGTAGRRRADALRAARARAWKQDVWALKAECEAGRRPGTTRYALWGSDPRRIVVPTDAASATEALPGPGGLRTDPLPAVGPAPAAPAPA